ncbi:MAG: hypothetical protein PUG73_11410, partial [Pseudomonadota bacterium]|nr:hypothetical protein [Pseudomonadota bacterium]
PKNEVMSARKTAGSERIIHAAKSGSVERDGICADYRNHPCGRGRQGRANHPSPVSERERLSQKSSTVLLRI